MKRKSNDFLSCMDGRLNKIVHLRSRFGQEVIIGIRDVTNRMDNSRIVPEDVERQCDPPAFFINGCNADFKWKRERSYLRIVALVDAPSKTSNQKWSSLQSSRTYIVTAHETLALANVPTASNRLENSSQSHSVLVRT